MKALLLSDYNHLEVADMPQPAPGADELLIRVAACGICGSDVHGYDGSTGRRIPPIVMGHEAAGTVAAVGSGVTGFRPGDRVTFDSTVYCGECVFCLRGEVNLCDNRQVVGVSCPEFRRAGAFAEYVTVPARIAYRLPDDLPSPKPPCSKPSPSPSTPSRSRPWSSANRPRHRRRHDRPPPPPGRRAPPAAGRIFVARRRRHPPRAARAISAQPRPSSHPSESRSRRQILELTDGRGVDVVLEGVGRDETVSHRHRLRAQRRHSHAGRQHLARASNSPCRRSSPARSACRAPAPPPASIPQCIDAHGQRRESRSLRSSPPSPRSKTGRRGSSACTPASPTS